MLRTALRNLFAHKARLMMTALAVLLGVAFVAGTLIFSDTVGEATKNASSRNLKDVAVSVQARATDSPDGPRQDSRWATALDQRVADRIRALPGVAGVRTDVTGEATLAARDDGRPVGNSGQNQVVNYLPGKDGSDPRYPLVRGRGPARADEIALAESTAKAVGYRLGDTVRLATDGPALEKRLVGIVATDDPAVNAGGSLALLDTATAQKLFLHPGQFNELLVAARPGTDQAALAAEVRRLLPAEDAWVASGDELAAQQAQMLAQKNRTLSRTLLVFAGIALLVGVFIIANTFTMLISQRSREIALLRAVGASRRQVVRSVLIEAGMLGLVSSAAGLAFGAGIAVGLRSFLGAQGAGFPDGPLVISPTAVLASLAVGVVVTVLAAWLPSRKAARIAPVQALNTIDAPPAMRSLAWRHTLGALLTAAGIAVMLVVSTLKGTDNLPLAMAGSALTLIGVMVLAPLLSRPLIFLAGLVTTRLFGISGKLAKDNALRNPRRTAATGSALMIGLTLITGLTVVSHSAQRAEDKMATTGLLADYMISTPESTGLDTKLSQNVAKIPGVTAMTPMRAATYTTNAAASGPGGGFGRLRGSDLDQIDKVTQLTFVQGSLEAVKRERDAIAVSQSSARKHGWRAGDTVTVEFPGQGTKPTALRIGAVYQDNPVLGDSFASTTLVDPHLHWLRNDTLLVKTDAGASPALARQIRKALGDSPLLKIQDHDDLRKEIAGQIDTAVYMIYGLLAMAVVIAVVGVVNTLAMSVFERTREIGMLRAIGLDRRQIKQMVRLESVVISLFGAALGMGLGIFLAWAGGQLLSNSESFKAYEMAMPWERLGLFVLIALIVGVLAAVWPARRAARLNMLQAIGTE
ncbi:ABC transporter permease [Streptomyces orinoci]|uniref:ABC transporter permease n=1 Tax=Streptomyces orinoci TaxID=67339 RepID=A0ABV3K429_STRON|nr:FtsX-like permease family protein [Streptomyces orinoci]